MSCCGGNCGCGSGCKCGSVFLCKMYPDMGYTKSSTSQTLIMGVATERAHLEGSEMGLEGSEMGVAAENGCKCGDNCTCDPCTCGK